MTFYPTLEEFSNLTKLIEYMESCGAHRAGIANRAVPQVHGAQVQRAAERASQLRHRSVPDAVAAQD